MINCALSESEEAMIREVRVALLTTASAEYQILKNFLLWTKNHLEEKKT